MPQYPSLGIFTWNYVTLQWTHYPLSTDIFLCKTCIATTLRIFKCDAIACYTPETRWISWLLMTINYRKVRIRITINIAQIIRGVENQTLGTCTLQILTYNFQSRLMVIMATEHITCTTFYWIIHVWTCVFCKIQHRANHNTADELPTRPYTIFILEQWLGLDRSPFDFGISIINPKLCYYSVNWSILTHLH